MNAEDTLLKFYSNPLSDQFKKIAKPLDDCFGLDGFFYSLTTPEGLGFQIANRPDVGHDYFSNQFYKTNPFICHPDNYQHNQVFITSDFYQQQHFENYYESIERIKNSFGFENYLCIYKKEADIAHVFMYSTTHKNLPSNTVFSHHLNALKRFSDHFIKEWSAHSKKMEAYMLNLGELMGDHFYKINQNLATNCNKQKIKELLWKLGLLERTSNTNFSKRELDCIEHFLMGKSANHIAESLEIQKRTVEHYLDNIKIKLNCFTKSELFEILQELKTFSLI